jgi:hypothetical protein
MLLLSQDIHVYNDEVGAILKLTYKYYRSVDDVPEEDPIRDRIACANDRFKGVTKQMISIQNLLEGRRNHKVLNAKIYKATERIINSIKKNRKTFALNFCLRRAMISAGYELPRLIKELETTIKLEDAR